MLTSRLAAPRWAVSLEDPALIPIAQTAPEKLSKYARTRNLDDLGGMAELEKLPTAPTMVKLAPMKAQFDHLENSPALLLSLHVDEWKNAPDSWNDFEAAGAGRGLSDKAMRLIPRNVVKEWGTLVRELANGDDAPFSSPDGWWERLSRRVAIAAIDARVVETASDDSSN